MAGPASPRPPAASAAPAVAQVPAASATAEVPPSGARASRYHDIVEQAARRHQVSADLIHAVIAVESAYRADAVSHRGAVGLMQLMPATAQRYGPTDLHDPAQNIHIGVQHLRELLEFFGGDVMLALAAYNAGAGAVMRYGGIPPYRETTQYVAKVLSRYEQNSDDASRGTDVEYGALPSR